MLIVRHTRSLPTRARAAQANKGYMLALWMALFTQSGSSRLGQNDHFASAWHQGVLSFAKEHRLGALTSQAYLSCGVCGACNDRLSHAAVRHNRSNGAAHALDILAPNVALMAGVANRTGVASRVSLHHLAGSNVTKPVKMWIGGSYKTNIQAGRESNGLCESDEICMAGNNSQTGRAVPV